MEKQGKKYVRDKQLKIFDAWMTGDTHTMNEELDTYPSGTRRPEVSVELANKAIKACSKEHDTEEMETV